MDNADKLISALLDVVSHRDSWRSAIKSNCTTWGSDDDGSYWDHELKVFDRTFAALAELSAAKAFIAALSTAPTREDEAGKLRAENAALREALKPFTKYDVCMIGMADSVIKRDYADCSWIIASCGAQPDFKHFWQAAEALSVSSTERQS